jgi:ABC-type transport system involved in multi-copper enzyme maturation permease subunit
MNVETKRVPTTIQVITAIARREVTMAMRRRLVKLLFLGNLIPPLVMAVILIVNAVARGFGAENLSWDPLVQLLQVQTGPVLLLALGIGAPLVARDRSEDVLFLYATRPVTPWSYTLGKMLAVAAPAVALLLIPGILIAILRAGFMDDFGLLDSLTLIARVMIAAVLTAIGFTGVSVGPSAATKKARWALFLTFLCFVIPHAISEIIHYFWGGRTYLMDPGRAVDEVIAALFEGPDAAYGMTGAICLVAWGTLGMLVTSAKVRREMIP